MALYDPILLPATPWTSPSERDAVSAQKLGQFQPFIADPGPKLSIPTGIH
jgi:hypothetical protein